MRAAHERISELGFPTRIAIQVRLRIKKRLETEKIATKYSGFLARRRLR